MLQLISALFDHRSAEKKPNWVPLLQPEHSRARRLQAEQRE
jgi:hypothetical protein